MNAYLVSQRRWREAEQSIKEAMTINPQDADPHIRMGNLLRDQDLPVEAEAE